MIHNNLWYIEHLRISQPKAKTATMNVIYSIQNNIKYSLWHSRLGNPGNATMQHINKGVHGVPKLEKPQFYTCPCCIKSKFTTQKKGYSMNPSRANASNEIYQTDF